MLTQLEGLRKHLISQRRLVSGWQPARLGPWCDSRSGVPEGFSQVAAQHSFGPFWTWAWAVIKRVSSTGTLCSPGAVIANMRITYDEWLSFQDKQATLAPREHRSARLLFTEIWREWDQGKSVIYAAQLNRGLDAVRTRAHARTHNNEGMPIILIKLNLQASIRDECPASMFYNICRQKTRSLQKVNHDLQHILLQWEKPQYLQFTTVLRITKKTVNHVSSHSICLLALTYRARNPCKTTFLSSKLVSN